MDKAAAIETLKRFHQGIAARGIQPVRLILYGSFASDANHEGSDIDVVVISDDFRGKDYWERCDILADVIYEIFSPIEAIPLTQEEWDQGDFFVIDFARDGEVLFEAA